MVVQGIKKGESPALMTMWSLLGFPLCSVAYPVWFNDSHLLPVLLKSGSNGNAPLCDKALKLKEDCFPVKRGHGDNYLNLPVLYNSRGTGIMQQLAPVETQVFTETNARMKSWRKDAPDSRELQLFYDTLDQLVAGAYVRIFGL